MVVAAVNMLEGVDQDAHQCIIFCKSPHGWIYAWLKIVPVIVHVSTNVKRIMVKAIIVTLLASAKKVRKVMHVFFF